MLDFAKKLLLARELRFEKGRFSVFSQRMVIFSSAFIGAVALECLKNPEFEEKIYEVMKETAYTFTKGFKKRLNLKDPLEISRILEDIAELNGYGIIKPIRKDLSSRIAVYHVEGLPAAEHLLRVLQPDEYAKYSTRTVDRYWAGMLAGGAAAAYDDKTIEGIETKCQFRGDPVCEFIIGPKDKITKINEKG